MVHVICQVGTVGAASASRARSYVAPEEVAWFMLGFTFALFVVGALIVWDMWRTR